ncbi:MAG TPA: hypothetical protein VIE64_04400 [Solirubrobacterales bacterium]|jgi:endogenous inhibitor of DNA gyrase (YacG/DUF329 family)
MANVMIKCPNTGKLVPTGIAMDAQSFASAQLSNNGLGNCPACGGGHVWSKKDAQLEEE